MKPATFHDVEGEPVTIGPDREALLVWLKPPKGEPLAFTPHEARAIGCALLSAADAARFPNALRQPQE